MYRPYKTSPYDWVRADNSLIAGVCSGLAPNFGLGKWAARMLWICLAFVFGAGIVMYLLCWLCMPRSSQARTACEPKILGGCLQIARRTGIEVGLVRCIVALLTGLSVGGALAVYLIFALILPYRPPESVDHGRRIHEPQSPSIL